MEIEIGGRSVLIDDDDALRFIGIALSVSSHGYLKVSYGRGREAYVHRIITNAAKGDYVDHINGNKLDNRQINLRVCTQSQNNCNHPLRRDNQCGVTGVCWDNKRLLWCAYIAFNKRRKFLGRYNSFDDAVAARSLAEDLHHGEYSAKNGVSQNEEI